MKLSFAATCGVFILGATAAIAQSKPAPTLKSILLEQLRTSHTAQEWFVPASKAVEGLTFQQASWNEGKGNHSIAQLVHHLTFWDGRQLEKFKDSKAPDFTGDNEATFAPPRDKQAWEAAVRQMDDVMRGWEQAVESADDAKLQSWYSTIAHIGMHNAYHTGQILYIRKLQGSWDPAKGVK